MHITNGRDSCLWRLYNCDYWLNINRSYTVLLIRYYFDITLFNPSIGVSIKLVWRLRPRIQSSFQKFSYRCIFGPIDLEYMGETAECIFRD